MLRFALVAVAVLASAPALASVQTRSIAVPVAAADFEARVERAARKVCAVQGVVPLRQVVAARACRAEAVRIAGEQRDAALRARTRLAAAETRAELDRN
jgi:hypothetical protein